MYDIVFDILQLEKIDFVGILPWYLVCENQNNAATTIEWQESDYI